MPTPSRISNLLAHGDRRTTGYVDRVIAMVLAEPETLAELVPCAFDPDSAVRMRAADALEKVSREQATLLHPYAALLLGLLEDSEQQEVQWHMAVLLPRLSLTLAQRSRVWNALERYLGAKSSIVRTCALQGMADLSKQDAALNTRTIDLLHSAERTGTAAMKARSRKLLKELTSPPKAGSRTLRS